jgi:hypothetical protein
MGSFTSLDMEESKLNLAWDPDEQLSAVLEQDREVVFLPVGTHEQACLTMNMWTGDISRPSLDRQCRMVFDDRDLHYFYDPEIEGLVLTFESELLGKRVTPTTDPTDYMMDLALRPSQVHETPVMYESFDEFHFVRLGPTQQFLKSLGTESDPTEANVITVYYYKDEAAAGRGDLSKTAVPALPWLDYGSVYSIPILGGYCLKTLDNLFKDAEAAVEFLLNYLPLNRRMQRKNRLALTMSYNAFVMSRVLGGSIPDIEDRIAMSTKGGVL